MTIPTFLDHLAPDLERLGALLESIGGLYRLMEIYRGDEATGAESAEIGRVCLDEFGVAPEMMCDHSGHFGAMTCDACNPD